MSEPTEEQETDNFLHIYGQVTYHDDALIVGTRSAIQLLRNACDKALVHGEHDLNTFSSDGEGYETTVRVVTDLDALDALPVHYIENCYTVKWARTQATNDALQNAAQKCHENMMLYRGRAVDDLGEWQHGMAYGAEKCRDDIEVMKVAP